MTAFRLQITEAILASTFTAIGLLWTCITVPDRFVWLLDYAAIAGFGVLFIGVMEYFKERKNYRRNSHYPKGVLWYADWLHFGLVVVSGIAMINVFVWLDVGDWQSGNVNWPLALFSWMVILAGASVGKLIAMYRFGSERTTGVA